MQKTKMIIAIATTILTAMITVPSFACGDGKMKNCHCAQACHCKSKTNCRCTNAVLKKTQPANALSTNVENS